MKNMTFIRALLCAETILVSAPWGAHGSPILHVSTPAHGSATVTADLSAPALVAPASTPFHGFTVRLTREGRVVVAACHYDGGTPVAGAQVTLFPPGADTPYQTGVTDRAGVFVFLPASPGEWRVVVDDGMGHRRETRIETVMAHETGIGSDADDGDSSGTTAAGEADRHDSQGDAGTGADQIHTHESDGAERPWKLATGLSLIFGLTGFAYGFTARRGRGRLT